MALPGVREISDSSPVTWKLSSVFESRLQGRRIRRSRVSGLWKVVSLPSWSDRGLQAQRRQGSKGSPSPLSCLSRPLRGCQKAEHA